MSVVDINGGPYGKAPTYSQGGYPSMSPALIGSGPSYQPAQQRQQSVVNNVIVPIGGDEDYRQQLVRKPTYVAQDNRQDDRVAGVKYRPKSGERSINDVFQMGQPS